MVVRNAIILHGKPSKEGYHNPRTPSASNSIWIPWLQQELMFRDVITQTPEMLRAFQPDYSLWSGIFEQYSLSPETLIVGHSCGAGFFLQWLCEHKSVRVGHVFLVAPAFGDVLTPDARYDVELLNGFGVFDLNEGVTDRVSSLNLIYSDNDSVRVNATVDVIIAKCPRISRTMLSGFGHFTKTGISQAPLEVFPQLLDIIDDVSGLRRN